MWDWEQLRKDLLELATSPAPDAKPIAGLDGVVIYVSDNVPPLHCAHHGCTILVGRAVDIPALIFCLRLSAEDREWLRGMYISLELEPAKGTTSTGISQGGK